VKQLALWLPGRGVEPALERSGLSLRKLQKIIAATLEARNATAVKH
jgi:hypothetical protein